MNSTSNPLTNILTPRIRAYLYAALFLGALVFGAWQAAEGDWAEFVGSVLTALLGLTAASNASWTPTDEDEMDGEVDATPLTDEEVASLPTHHVHGNDSGSNDYGYGDPHRP